jgi:RNA polymerase sigma-70 factor (ECF subfamily)
MAVRHSTIKITKPINGILPAFSYTYVLKERIRVMEDEQTLLAALRDLDPEAITRAHEVYFPVVYRYAHYRTGDETIAEDLASEAIFRLLEALHTRRGPNSSLRGWLMGTISNLVNDYYRKIYNKPTEQLGDGIPDQISNPAFQSERSDQHAALRTALLELTPSQQNVLALRFGSGCSLAETAEILQKNINAIKQLQFRAMVALRNSISGVNE